MYQTVTLTLKDGTSLTCYPSTRMPVERIRDLDGMKSQQMAADVLADVLMAQEVDAIEFFGGPIGFPPEANTVRRAAEC